jgi:hypothetical protein
MKHKRLVTLALVLMVLSFQVMNAAAQTGRRGKANIPFDFVVNNRVLPAGSYYLTQNGPNLIGLASKTDVVVSIGLHKFDEASFKTPSLVFHKIGHKYFLEEVWLDWNTGLRIPGTAREKETLLANQREPVNTVVPLR